MTDPNPLDITNIPALRHVVEEMRANKQPRFLKQDCESVAILMPLGTLLNQHLPTTKDDLWGDYDAGKVREALAQSAGTHSQVSTKKVF